MALVTAKQVKTVVKRCVKVAAFDELKKIQLEHTNIQDIVHPKYTMPAYMETICFLLKKYQHYSS